MKELEGKKVAIVHDWLVGGGSEQVVLALHQMFPNAPIYTSYCTDEWSRKLDDKVVTGYLQYWPFSKLRKFIPFLRFWWFSHLKFDGYDLVISSSGNGEAKSVKVPEGTKHVCYCHTPPHFLWRHYNEYIKNPGFGLLNPLARLGLKILVGPLRKWDLRAAKNPNQFIANSTHIQEDIKKYYGRDSVVIHPPVNIARFANLKPRQRHGFITVGRQVPYKKTDIIVASCTELNLPLTVVGDGPDHKKLVKIAGPTIKFDTHASDEDVANYLASAEVFIFAAFEDFGITPVEALAAGTPVIAYKAGGALDYIVPGQNGEFFEEQTVDSLSNTIIKFGFNKNKNFDLLKFSKENFNKQFVLLIK